MATYYVDPAATGNNDGGGDGVDPSDPTQAANWTDAWTDMQSAATNAAAGDIVYCRGTQTLTSTITVANSGSAASGYIRFIGCNAAGVNDGTRFNLNGDSAVTAVLSFGNKSFIWIENLEVYSSTQGGIVTGGTGVYNIVAINCLARNNGRDGWHGASQLNGCLVGCGAANNGWYGFYLSSSYPPTVIGCWATGNVYSGFRLGAGLCNPPAIACVSYDNTQHGFDLNASQIILFNCVADNNGMNGVTSGNYPAVLFGCRLTNNGTGATARYGAHNNANYRGVYGWNFLNGNKDGATGGGNWDAIPFKDDADTNETSGTEGYTNAASGDYNLTSDATLRSVAIEID